MTEKDTGNQSAPKGSEHGNVIEVSSKREPGGEPVTVIIEQGKDGQPGRVIDVAPTKNEPIQQS